LADCVLLCWSYRRARSRGRLAQARLALDIPKMIFEAMLQISRSTAKFRHDLAQIPRQFRQLFRPKHHQNHHENYDQMWNAEHFEVSWAVRCRGCSLSLIPAPRTPFFANFTPLFKTYFAAALG
jgi:hypothetical protein